MNSPTMNLPQMDYDAAASDLATAIALLQRIGRTRRFTPEVAHQMHGMPHAAWLREYCTVHVGAGRGIGKSTVVLGLARAGDVVLVPRRHSVPSEITRAARPGEPMRTPLGAKVVLAADFERFAQQTRMRDIVTVYVDEPHVVFGHGNGLQHDHFLGLLGALRFEGQIVMVGQP
jgi:hypothetical protein